MNREELIEKAKDYLKHNLDGYEESVDYSDNTQLMADFVLSLEQNPNWDEWRNKWNIYLRDNVVNKEQLHIPDVFSWLSKYWLAPLPMSSGTTDSNTTFIQQSQSINWDGLTKRFDEYVNNSYGVHDEELIGYSRLFYWLKQQPEFQSIQKEIKYPELITDETIKQYNSDLPKEYQKGWNHCIEEIKELNKGE